MKQFFEIISLLTSKYCSTQLNMDAASCKSSQVALTIHPLDRRVDLPTTQET